MSSLSKFIEVGILQYAEGVVARFCKTLREINLISNYSKRRLIGPFCMLFLANCDDHQPIDLLTRMSLK